MRTVYELGPFRLDTEARVLTRDGVATALGPRGIAVLAALVSRAGQYVDKSVIVDTAWAGTVVEEANLAVQVSAIRRVLAQVPQGENWIETLPRRGYRFVGPVAAGPDGGGARATTRGRPSPITVPPPASCGSNAKDAPDIAIPDRPSIAVLPFANMSGDPAQEYFADGIVDDIISALARMEVFFVVARTSSFVYKGKAVDARQVGHELGVRYLLEGSVRRSADRVRLSGQLIEAESGRHVWADRFEGTIDDVFELQDRLTDSIVSAVEPSVRRAELERSRVQRTSNPNAYDLLLRSVPTLTNPDASRERMDEALWWIRRALDADPRYSLAKALAAYACATRMVNGYGTADDVKAGLRYADEALSERSGDPLVLSYAGAVIGGLGYRALGFRALGFRYDEAQRAVELALRLSPSLLMVQVCAGQVRTILAEGDAALAHFQRAIRISPVDPAMGAFIASTAMAHVLAKRFDEAVAAAEHAMQTNPKLVLSYRVMVLALGSLNRHEEAKAMGQQLLGLAPEFTVSRYQSVSPLKDSALRKRYGDIYRSAGIPK